MFRGARRALYVKKLGPELLNTSGASGTATAANWIPNAAAILTNPSTGILKVARDGVNNPRAANEAVIVGKRYRFRAEGRSDGNAVPVIQDSLFANLQTGTTSTDWQTFDVEYVAQSTQPRLQSTTSTGTEYTEWRNLSVREVL